MCVPNCLLSASNNFIYILGTILHVCIPLSFLVSAKLTGSLDVFVALDDGTFVNRHSFKDGNNFILSLIRLLPKVHRCFLQVSFNILIKIPF